jgi:hypothetical protein
MRLLLGTLAAVLALGSANAWAGTNCTCRAEGVQVTIGETVCLKTPSGLRLARCEMVLNNTSWKFLPGACPQASLAVSRQIAMSVAPADGVSLR